MRSPPPPDPLNTRLGVMRSFWLHVRCAQGHSSTPPLNLLAKQHRACTLSCVMARFRCHFCSGRPHSAILAETAYLNNQGMAGAYTGWRIELVRHGLPVPSLMVEYDERPPEILWAKAQP